MEEHDKDPAKRIAQHKLADEVLKLVHGKEVAEEAKREHSILFMKSSGPKKQTDEDGNQSSDSVDKAVPLRGTQVLPPHSIVLPKSLVYNQRMSRVIYHAGLVPSRSEGHRLVVKKGVYLGARPGGSGTLGEQVDWSPAADWEGKETEKYIVGDDRLIVRVGKWKIKIIKIISDEEFEEQGLSAPGWKDDNFQVRLPQDLQNMKAWNQKKYVRNAPIHQVKW